LVFADDKLSKVLQLEKLLKDLIKYYLSDVKIKSFDGETKEFEML